MGMGWRWYEDIGKKLEAVRNEIPKRSRVLDVGCNSGEMGIMLREANHCGIVGLDISISLLNRAKHKNLNVVCGDAERLPFKNGEFGAVFLGEIIEHSYNPKDILLECSRVLKPKGWLVGTTVDEDFMSSYPEFYQEKWHWDDKRLHAKIYSVETMKKLIDKYFTNTKVYRVIEKNTSPWIIFKGRKDA